MCSLKRRELDRRCLPCSEENEGMGAKKKGIVLDIMNCSHILIIDGQSHLLTGTRMWVAIRGTATWNADWLLEELVVPLWTNKHVYTDSRLFKHTGWGWGWGFACCSLTKVWLLAQPLRPSSKLKIIKSSVWWNESRTEEKRDLSVQSKCREKTKGLKWILFAPKGHKLLRGEIRD